MAGRVGQMETQRMRLRLLPFLLPLVAVAGLGLLSGCSSTPTKRAATRSADTTTTPAVTTSLAPVAASGKVHLTDYTDNDGPTTTVVLTGAIGDYGKAQRVTSNGSTSAQLGLTLTHGSFRLDITDLDKTFLGVLSNLAVNTVTCSATASVSGPVPVIAGSGTGSYKGIAGTFNLSITLDEVYRRDACNTSGAYLSQSIITTGSGAVSFH
jgi:hypothetical protein